MGGRFFSLARLGRREVSDGKTLWGLIRARVGYLGLSLGLVKEKRRPDKQGLGVSKWVECSFAGPRGRLGRLALAVSCLEALGGHCLHDRSLPDKLHLREAFTLESHQMIVTTWLCLLLLAVQ